MNTSEKTIINSNNYAVKPVPELTVDEIKTIRKSVGLTQAKFAEVLGISPRTVASWEIGINRPSGSSARLISLIREDPKFIERYKLITKMSD
ncbi:MAG: helix-turn-helix domain-containing protein [Clostridium sp.]|nr:helix-turn-helix domain-containing protein [Clostridium sp.]